MAIELPTHKTKQGVNLAEFVWVFYGPPGVGKSTLASGFISEGRSPLFLWTSSVRYIDAYKQPIEDWRMFKQVIRQLQAKRPKIYSVIVVDVVDSLYMLCRDDRMAAMGVEHESELEHGKGWDVVKKEFTSQIARLVTLGYGVVFISHAYNREVRTRALTYHKMVPALQGAAWQKIYPLADAVGYCGFSSREEGEETKRTPRRIFFEPTEYIEAKDWTGRLPKEQVMWQDPRRTVQEMEAALMGLPVQNKKRPSRKVVRRRG